MTTLNIDIFVHDNSTPTLIFHFQITLYFYNTIEEQINRDYADLLASAELPLNDFENDPNWSFNPINSNPINSMGTGTEDGIRAYPNTQTDNYFNEENHLNTYRFEDTSFNDIDWNLPSP